MTSTPTGDAWPASLTRDCLLAWMRRRYRFLSSYGDQALLECAERGYAAIERLPAATRTPRESRLVDEILPAVRTAIVDGRAGETRGG